MADGREMHRRYANWSVALVLLVTVAVYGQILWHQFLFSWDDYEYVVNNPAIREWTWKNLRTVFSTYYVGNYAPVQMLSYMLDHALWGLWAGGFLITNLVLHCVNGLLLYRLLLRFHGHRLTAIVGMSLFLLHPVQVEAVVWISQRKTLLSLCFFLLAWEAYDHYRRSNAGRGRIVAYVESLLLLLLALLAKSVAVIFPVLVWLEELCVRPVGHRPRWLDKLPFLAVAGAVAVLAIVSQTPDQQVWGAGGGRAGYHGGSPFATALTMLPVFCRYLGLLLWPVGLSALYDPKIHATVDLAVVAAALLLGGVSMLAIILFRRDRKAGFWLLFFPVALLPVSQIVPLVTLMNDRYLYFPMLAVGALGGIGAQYLQRRFPLSSVRGFLLSAAPVLVLALVSYQRIGVWQDPVTLWRDTTQKSPRLARAWEGLGEACHFWSQNLHAEALQAYQRSFELDPTSDLPLYNLGVLYCQMGQWDKAHETFTHLLRRSPQNVMGLTALGDVHRSLHEYEEAEQDYRRALRLQPDAEVILTKLGDLAMLQGEVDQARAHYLRVESLSGGEDPMNAFHLAKTESQAGDATAALAWLERALQRGFRDASAIMDEESFVPLRADGRFSTLMQRYFSSEGASSGPAGR
jgi:tetratricopeptide (TPR) repeat protein